MITQEGVQFANSLRSASGYYLSAAAFVAWLPRLPVADKIAAYEAVAVVKRSDGAGSMYGDWMTHDQIYRCTFALCSRLLAQYRSRFEPDPDAIKADAITYLHALEAGDTDAARRASAPYLPQSPVAASSAHVVELATAAAFTQTLTETAVHYLRVIDGLVGERNGTHASREDWMNETRIPSTNETRHPPTGWWAKLGGDDQIVTVARWFWPPSTTVEVWDRHEREWDDRPIFLALHDEPSWQEVDEPAVQDWISAHKP